MAESKLYMCFEATNLNEETVYLIYSAKLSDLKGDSRPNFTFENSITGVSSMGCGLFQSKIVLAGGVSVKEQDYNRGLLTYDTITRQVSTDYIPSMRGRKIRPLVFELYGRLYVLDTSNSVYKRTCEVYYPSLKLWDKVSDPFCNIFNRRSGSKNISGRTPYSWFTNGKSVSISSPHSRTYFHHARQMLKAFSIDETDPLPFHGMAVTYYQRGFRDVIVISFSKGEVGGEGRVEGRRLRYFPDFFTETQLLFRTDPFENPDGEVSAYFAKCKSGKFCLITFDNVNTHVYIFEVFRNKGMQGVPSLVLDALHTHKYNYNDFSHEGITSISSISGCFVLPQDDETKRSADTKLYYNILSGYELGEDDDDLPPVVEIDGGFKIEDDSDGADSDFRDEPF